MPWGLVELINKNMNDKKIVPFTRHGDSYDFLLVKENTVKDIIESRFFDIIPIDFD
jgi:hypothetical protein